MQKSSPQFILRKTEFVIHIDIPMSQNGKFFSNKLKLMNKAGRKAYIVDNGFIAARAFELSRNLGRLLCSPYTLSNTFFFSTGVCAIQ